MQADEKENADPKQADNVTTDNTLYFINTDSTTALMELDDYDTDDEDESYDEPYTMTSEEWQAIIDEEVAEWRRTADIEPLERQEPDQNLEKLLKNLTQ